jgi:predicted phosphodiesterase
MRIALISDIHANFSALHAVLSDVRRKRPDAYWCLGDIIGRGFEPVAVSRRMRELYDAQPPEHQAAWLKGNHEMLVLEELSNAFTSDGTPVSGHTRITVEWAIRNREILTSIGEEATELFDWLRGFPNIRTTPFPNIYMAHGAYVIDGEQGVVDPTNAYFMYVRKPFDAELQLRTTSEHVGGGGGLILSGHSHMSQLYLWDGEHALEQPHHTEQLTFDLTSQWVYANPGSVGFPRKPDTCPTYMLLDFTDDFASVKVRTVTVRYDVGRIEFPYDSPERYRNEILACGANDE